MRFARVEVGDWVLQATGGGWDVFQIHEIKTGVNAGRMAKKNLTQYASLQTALGGLEEKWMRRSGAKTIADLRMSHLEFRAALTKLFTLTAKG